MSIKKYCLVIGLCVAMFCGSAKAAKTMYFSDFLYSSAQRGNISVIQSYLAKGYSVDAVTPDGMTALCYSIYRKNFSVYRNLRSLGANQNHYCMQKVDEATAEDFARRFDEIGAVEIQEIKEESDNDNTMLYTTVGVAAVGGAAILLLDDSGSSSSNHNDSNDEGDNGNEDDSGEEIDCEVGTRWDGRKCAPIECPDNTQLVGNICVVVSSDDVKENPNGDEDFYGVVSDSEKIYNLYSDPNYKKEESNIYLKSEGKGNVYGMYGSDYSEVMNAFVGGSDMSGVANIGIDVKGSGTVYGLYSQIEDITQYKEVINAVADSGATAQGNININHTGVGSSYGVFGDVRAYNTEATNNGVAHGNINITSDGNIYGVSGYVATTNALSLTGKEAIGKIHLNSIGDGDVYGMMVDRANVPGAGTGGAELASWFAFNSYLQGGDYTEGEIKIRNVGDGNVYGMYGGQQLYNAYKVFGNDGSVAKGVIDIENHGDGNVYGMYLPETDAQAIIANYGGEDVQSYINIVNTGDGVTTGMRGGQLMKIVNSGEITINNVGNGTAVGIYAEEGADVKNSGLIKITREEYTDENGINYKPDNKIGGTAYGIYAEKNAKVENSGKIEISNAGNGAGIYLEEGAELVNGGDIIFNEEQNSIVENGGGIDIYGNRSEKLAIVNVDSLGKGKVVLDEGGRFFADKLSGNIEVSKNTVSSEFENSYVLKDVLQANDVSELGLVSQSVLFDAKTNESEDKSGYDVVLERKGFADVVKDKNVANFLEVNYQEKNGEKIFDILKQEETIGGLNDKVNNISGADVIPHFRKEDALVYSNLSRQFNDNLFNKPDENYIAGYEYMDISTDADGNLVASDSSVHAAYGMLKNKNDYGIVYGVGASIAQIDSDYDNGSSRKNNIFGVWAPVGYDFNNGLKWFSKAYLGYADGSYDRVGVLGKYSSDIEEYQYGLSNEVRYDILLNGFKLQPLAELNLLGIYQDGFDEGNKEGAIKADSNNSLSLEAGLGTYLSKDIVFDDDNKLGISIGGVYYVEFLDPDDGIDAGINGFDGKYKIRHNTDDGRAVFRAKADYNYKDLSLYAIVEQEFGNNEAFTVDVGAQYKF